MRRLPLWFAIGGLILLCWAAVDGVIARSDAASRYRRAVLGAQSPQLRAAAGVAIVAADRATAQYRLESLIADRASRVGLRISIVARPPETDQVVAAHLGGSGSETAIRAFIASLEGGRPTVRLSKWSIRPQGDALRFDADAIAFRQSVGATAASGAVLIAAPVPQASAEGEGLFATSGAADGAPTSSGPPELVGIVGRLAIDPQAIVRLADGSTRTLAPGQAIGTWRLVAIGADRVRFGRAGVERIVVLPTAAGSGQPGQ